MQARDLEKTSRHHQYIPKADKPREKAKPWSRAGSMKRQEQAS